MKRKSTSILGIVIAVLLLIVVAISLGTNVIFSRHDTPKLFGRYIYLMESDCMEVQPDTVLADGTTVTSTNASIHAKTAVICDAYVRGVTDVPSKNNAILCLLSPEDTSPDKDNDGIVIRRILSVASDEETGILKFYPTTMVQETIGTEPAITEDSILGLCRYESDQLYNFITFTTSMTGIIALLAAPAFLLLILLIIAIVRRSAGKRNDDAYGFEESYDDLIGEDGYEDGGDSYGADGFVSNDGGAAPEYTPVSTAAPAQSQNYNTSSFEVKKATIAQNFQPKAVNPNSPYQIAKTMQFQAQKDVQINTTPFSQTSQQPAVSPENISYTGKYNVNTQPAETTVPDAVQSFTLPNVQAEDAPQQTYHGSHEATPGSSANKNYFRSSRTARKGSINVSALLNTQEAAQPAQPPKRSTSSSYSNKRSNNYDDYSVDDLLSKIENEKKRLR